MAIVKRTLNIPTVYAGDADTYLRAVALGMTALKQELQVLPGTTVMVAAEAITRGQAVSLYNGTLVKASTASSRPAVGIALTTAAIGQPCRFILASGLATGLSGLTANSSVYLGAAGALVFAKPGSGMIQGLGFAISATDMLVNICQP